MWISLPKAAKELEVGEAWLRQEVLKSYNFPMDSPLKINVHWRIIGKRYQINIESFSAISNSQYPNMWKKVVKGAIKKTLKEEKLYTPGLENSLLESILNALSNS